MVPRSLRDTWQEEWLGELWQAERQPDRFSRLRWLGLAIIRDALQVRRSMRAVGAPDGSDMGGVLSDVAGSRNLMRDVKFAVRALLRAPGFLGATVASLMLGFGGAVAIFAVLDSVVLEELPYPDSRRLVDIHSTVPGLGFERWEVAEAPYFHFRDNVRALAGLAGYQEGESTLAVAGAAERVSHALVTASLFELLGATSTAGRLFGEREDVPGGEPVVVLSHAYWVRRFGGSPAAVGRVLAIDGQPTEVVGVLPPGFELLDTDVEVWLPLRLDQSATPMNTHNVNVIGRLTEGATLDGLQGELDELTRGFPQSFPSAYAAAWMDESGFRTVAVPLHGLVVGEDVVRTLWVLMAAVAVVLLVAAANATNLVLVRTELRAGQFAVRRALGGTSADLFRSLLTESLLVAFAGTAAGVALAAAGLNVLRSAGPDALPRLDSIGIDASTVVLCMLLAGLLAIFLALAPLAYLASRRGPRAIMPVGVRQASGTTRAAGRGGLVALQVAFALVLLSTSGLVTRSALELAGVDPGFDPEGVLAVDVPLLRSSHPSQDAVHGFFRELLERVRSIPGVVHAGAVTGLPLDGEQPCWAFYWESDPSAGSDPPPCISSFMVTPGYFETLRVPLREGRWPSDVDNETRAGATVVTGAMAQRIWPDGAPLDQGLSIHGYREPWFRVVGVTGPLLMESLEAPPIAAVFFPMTSPPEARAGLFTMRSMTLVVRASDVPPLALLEPVRGALRETDPSVPLANVRVMSDVMRSARADVTLSMVLLLMAAATGSFLGAVGLYGVLSYSLARRSPEIGVRLALGADRSAILKMVLASSGRMVLPGIALGLLGALLLAPVLESLLFGVEARDVLTLSLVALLLTGVAFAASVLPALRALRVDAVRALGASAE